MITTLPKTLTQRIALRQALGQDGYQDALLKIAGGDTETLEKWSESRKRDEMEERKQIIFDQWLGGATEREIANRLCIGRNAVHGVHYLILAHKYSKSLSSRRLGHLSYEVSGKASPKFNGDFLCQRTPVKKGVMLPAPRE